MNDDPRMNLSTTPCPYNASSCYHIDNGNNCLSDNMVLQLILKYVSITYYEWIFIILYVIVFIVGTIGNLLVIIVIQRNRSMRTVTNIFIMNLAAADLLVLVFCLPATAIQDVTKTWFFGLVLCKFVNYIQNMSISVSVLTLMAISVERYQAIVHPLKFTGTKQRARILILSVWILSLLLVLPDAIMMTLSRQFGDQIETIYLTYCQWDAHPVFDLIYQLHISFCLFIIPLCFMVFTYSGIVKVLWGSLPSERVLNDEKRAMYSSQYKLAAQVDESHVNSPMNCNSCLINTNKSSNLTIQENRQKAAKMLIYVVIIFVICYIPVHVFNLFRYIFVYLEYIKRPIMVASNSTSETVDCFEPKLVALDRTGTIKIITISALISHILPYFNSSINPIIYNMMSDKFRLKFRELFSSCCCCFESALKLKSISSSTIIQLKAAGAQQINQPATIQNRNRYRLKNTHQYIAAKYPIRSSGSLQASSTPPQNKIARHGRINTYVHNGPIAIRLTNV
ncbi:unnamed protein product [Rotaria magnacalcarata]|uniref:G-protein coupled receptors family 1 profile domain-containing protein n=1 Tax=Rotaria magnacalcarata TaxID=392030 RepID=A0A816DDK5_9BILA|nr:unnamed protein product [Rotaria magnacalcarata]CAF1632733.1 unnamed protein product [Rotaria magnacalcarata]CAF2075953.1 unnamed protein product [Rotaria magnacalcarata]CAF3804111.1 unnamed protein product [Rotaria magnacalcarata]CAF3820188.1 unnamed protein product [Rotaria magnacalcarata]